MNIYIIFLTHLGLVKNIYVCKMDHRWFRHWLVAYSLQWRHNECDGVSNHWLGVPCLCVGNSPETGEFPAEKASNAENVSIWWRHHVVTGHYLNKCLPIVHSTLETNFADILIKMKIFSFGKSYLEMPSEKFRSYWSQSVITPTVPKRSAPGIKLMLYIFVEI